MTIQHRRTLVEALGIAVTGILLSILFSGIMGKGIFSTSAESTPPGEQTSQGSTFLNLEEAEKLHTSHHALFIDARNPGEYSLGHVSGAINLPLNDYSANHPVVSALRKDQLLVVYCDGEECNSSVELGKLLYESGFSQVKIFFSGWNAWQLHKQPMEP